MYIYTASKVKPRLNIFREKTVKLSKHEFILVIFMKLDKVVAICSNFDSISLRLTIRHGKYTRTCTPKMSLFTPLLSFSYYMYYEMKIVSVTLLLNQKHDLSVYFR